MALAFKTLGGEGHDVVLIHGFGSDRLSWLGNSPALMPLAKLHALDLPGHGDSSLESAAVRLKFSQMKWKRRSMRKEFRKRTSLRIRSAAA